MVDKHISIISPHHDQTPRWSPSGLLKALCPWLMLLSHIWSPWNQWHFLKNTIALNLWSLPTFNALHGQQAFFALLLGQTPQTQLRGFLFQEAAVTTHPTEPMLTSLWPIQQSPYTLPSGPFSRAHTHLPLTHPIGPIHASLQKNNKSFDFYPWIQETCQINERLIEMCFQCGVFWNRVSL